MRKSDKIVRQEASAWVSRLEGSPDATERAAFARWIEADPRHRNAYDRAAGSYQSAGIIRNSPIGRGRSLEAAFPRRSATMARGLATAAVVGLVLVGGFQLAGGSLLGDPLPIQSVMLIADTAARVVKLEDGSSVLLDPSSRVRVDLGKAERRARLEDGRARFIIAPEKRPFVVEAGTARVVRSEGGVVADIENGVGEVGTFAPDQSALIGQRPDAPSASVARLDPPRNRILNFRSTPLGDAVAVANAHSGGSRIMIDPSLAGRRVTGRFDATDTASLAASLAAAFDLRLAKFPDGRLLLTPSNK